MPRLKLAYICFILLATTQCSRNEDQARRDASTVTVFHRGDERLLGPAYEDTQQFLMFSNLWNLTKDGAPEPGLAERWETSDDCRTWTFYLRHDVRWHDGVQMTAYDAKFSLELFAHPAALYSDADLWINMESVTVLDDYTFRVTYDRPRCGYPDDWNIFYPKHLLEDLDPKEFYSWDFWTHPIGNGPYRYVRHVPKIMMELEANPDYYKGKPKIERVVFKLGGGDPLIELLSGNVDIVWYFDEDDLSKLPADGRFRLCQSFEPWHYLAIYWNHRHSLFSDAKVRRALTMAINRHELLQVLNFSENTPIFDGICRDPRDQREESIDSLPYDPDRAKQLLEEAGWRDPDGDGIRERNGKEARFTALVAGTASAVYIQAQLLRVGIKMEVRPLALAALRVRLRDGEFEAAFDNFSLDERSILWFSPDSPIGYPNPQIAEFFQPAWNLSEYEEKRNRKCDEVNRIFQEEIPITLVSCGVSTTVVNRRIRGLEGHVGAGEPIWRMAELWVEEE